MERNPVSEVIFNAIYDNNINHIKYWVDNKIDFNGDFDDDGNTPLIVAINQKNIKIINLLIKGGADINGIMNEEPYWTPLECAVQEVGSKNKEIIKILFEAGADKNNILEEALVINAPTENIKLLFDYGVSVNTPGTNMSPLDYAILYCRLDVIELLIDEGAHINMHSNTGTTPLIEAIKNGPCRNRISIINLLIRSGADVNKEGAHDLTPLHIAALFGNLSIVSILLKAGAKVNEKIMLDVVKDGKINVVRMLLKAGAPINKKIIEEAGNNIKPILNASVRGKDLNKVETVLNKINNTNLPRLPAEVRAKVASYLSGTEGKKGILHGPKLPGVEANYIGNQRRELKDIIGGTRKKGHFFRNKTRRH